MKIKGYNNYHRGAQLLISVLPSIDIFITSYLVDVQFSWLIWTAEWTIWESEE